MSLSPAQWLPGAISRRDSTRRWIARQRQRRSRSLTNEPGRHAPAPPALLFRPIPQAVSAFATPVEFFASPKMPELASNFLKTPFHLVLVDRAAHWLVRIHPQLGSRSMARLTTRTVQVCALAHGVGCGHFPRWQGQAPGQGFSSLSVRPEFGRRQVFHSPLPVICRQGRKGARKKS